MKQIAEQLTKREALAALAPQDVPDWFEYKSELKPEKPMEWAEVSDPEHREILRSWHFDPCYDLPDYLKWYQEKWERYWEERKNHKNIIVSERYFAWRRYFADQILKVTSDEKVD